MDLLKEIAYHIEVHDVNGIRDCFENGLDSNDEYDGKPLFNLLTSMYTRTPRFKDCIQVFVDAGLDFEDKILLEVLVDDAEALYSQLQKDPNLLNRTVDLECAYTPLRGATLLRVCAEYNHVECAKVLLNAGLDVDTKAGFDESGFGGQTPIFHTVNQNMNSSKEIMDLLLYYGSNLEYTVKGLVWGEGFPWETFVPAINPISYAMMGLLPQMHRDEKVISKIVSKLMKHAYGIDYKSGNVPNEYLKNK